MNIIKFEEIESKIITIRDIQVILDSDVAELYGVDTRDLNKSLKNNPDKFPEGYVFTLTRSEKSEVVENFHHLNKLKFSPHLPKAFTEKGLYMLATILKSSQATATTIMIIETFSKMRELGRNIRELSTIQKDEDKYPIMRKSGELISEIFDEDLTTDGTETTIELNFAVLKLKHTIKKTKK